MTDYAQQGHHVVDEFFAATAHAEDKYEAAVQSIMDEMDRDGVSESMKNAVVVEVYRYLTAKIAEKEASGD